MQELLQTTTQIIEPESTISYILTNDTGRLENTSTVSTTNESPIVVLEDRIRIRGDRISVNKYYPFVYKGKRYLFHKPTNGVSEVYLVKE